MILLVGRLIVSVQRDGTIGERIENGTSGIGFKTCPLDECRQLAKLRLSSDPQVPSQILNSYHLRTEKGINDGNLELCQAAIYYSIRERGTHPERLIKPEPNALANGFHIKHECIELTQYKLITEGAPL